MRLTAKCLKSKTAVAEKPALVGKIAVTDSPLNPFGTALIDGELFDVQTHGEHIDSGRGVRVTSVRGKKIYVTRV